MIIAYCNLCHHSDLGTPVPLGRNPHASRFYCFRCIKSALAKMKPKRKYVRKAS